MRESFLPPSPVVLIVRMAHRYRTLKKRFVSTVLVMVGDHKATDRGGAAQAAPASLPPLLHAVDRM